MGPTASGKTDIAVGLCKRFPFDIISVDSALVYRGMDIGTARPDAETLRRTPHRLIDIRDPEDTYSAGDFVRDARIEMDRIAAAGRMPLLVGGTMMYFRALIGGIAALPTADDRIRAQIDADADELGWPALHEKLREVDPAAADRINRNDSQRIQRALEVYRVSGKPLTAWQYEASQNSARDDWRYAKIALQISSREVLNARIEQRLDSMINNGFLEEVQTLRRRPGLTRRQPSMRAVGYRQFWEHAVGECSLDEAKAQTLAATRRLAKRQLTWLRSEAELTSFDPLEACAIDAISAHLAGKLL